MFLYIFTFRGLSHLCLFLFFSTHRPLIWSSKVQSVQICAGKTVLLLALSLHAPCLPTCWSFWFILPGFLYSLRYRYTHSYFLISAYFLHKEYHRGRCYFALCFFHLKMYPENYSVSAHGSLSFSCLRLHAMC